MHNKRCAGTRFADHFDLPAILVNQFSAVIEPDSHPHTSHHRRTGALGAEKRLEDPVLQMLGDPWTSILYAHLDTRSITGRS